MIYATNELVLKVRSLLAAELDGRRCLQQNSIRKLESTSSSAQRKCGVIQDC